MPAQAAGDLPHTFRRIFPDDTFVLIEVATNKYTLAVLGLLKAVDSYNKNSRNHRQWCKN